jgi:1,4-dihydroxy-2-naphthoate octaprenyltransferase
MSFAAGLWRLADPKVSLASFASLFLGLASSASEAPLSWGWLLATVAGIFAVEVAKNASGEVFDFDSGVDQAVSADDRSPFSGGKRVLVDDLLSRGQTWGIALGGYGLATLVGLLICLLREPRVLAFGLAGMALAFFYHAPPLRLAYRGLGEIAVAIAYGPLIALGAFVVQTKRFDGVLAWQSVSLGLLIAAFLISNEFPDYRADRGGGKRNLVVRLGRVRAARLYLLVAGLAYLLLAGLVLHHANAWLLGGMLGLPVSCWAAWRLSEAPEAVERIVAAQAASLFAFLMFALGAGAGLLLGAS